MLGVIHLHAETGFVDEVSPYGSPTCVSKENVKSITMNIYTLFFSYMNKKICVYVMMLGIQDARNSTRTIDVDEIVLSSYLFTSKQACSIWLFFMYNH